MEVQVLVLHVSNEFLSKVKEIMDEIEMLVTNNFNEFPE